MNLRLVTEPKRRSAPLREHTRERTIEPDGPHFVDSAGPWGEVLLIALLALLVRLVRLDHTPQTDELNHILAARSLLENGTLELVAGGAEYTRGWLLTYMVAGLFWLFGESLVVARLPALAAGVALVAAVFVAVRWVGGRTAGWIAGLLVCFSPIILYQSQQARFYTLQALFFLVGAVAVYLLSEPGTRGVRRILPLALVAGVSFAIALHFQIATVAGIAAVLAWLGGSLALRVLARLPTTRARLAVIAAGVFALAAVALLALQTGLVHDLVSQATRVDIWAEYQAGNPRYYHWLFLEQYATIWTLFPLLVLVAVARYGRGALFCGVVFGTVLVAHSIAAWKAERYIMYSLPFFFAIAGLGVAEILRWAVPRLRDWIATHALPRSAPAGAAGALASVVMAGALLFAVAGNGASSYSLRMMLTADGDWFLKEQYRGESDWAAAAAFIGPGVENYDVIVASSELKSTYFLGRIDYDLVPETKYTHGMVPDSVSYKTGAPWVVHEAALDEVVGCHESGLVLIERGHWLEPIGVNPPMTDYLLERTEAVEVPEAWRLRVFRWRHPDFNRPAECILGE